MSSTTITQAYAKPNGKSEYYTAFQSIINALLGTWGTNEWTGGLSNVVQGWYRDYSNYWTAKLVADITGDVTIQLPYKANYTTVRVIDTASKVETLYYIQDGSSLLISGSGLSIVYIDETRRKK